MRAYELRGRGLEQLVFVERPSPRPAAGQVRVRIRAASLNHRDLYVVDGAQGRAAVQHPLVPLSDGAGEVLELGPGVQHLAVGDRVMSAFFPRWVEGPPYSGTQGLTLGGTTDGVLAEEVVLEAATTIGIPDTLSFEEASTLPCAGLTAWVGLSALGHLQPGETVLAMGTGGVSIFALQIAKAMGASVIVTSSGDDKLARAKAMGADGVINYRQTPAWDVRARALTNEQGVDHILEVGGAKTLATSLRALRDGGHLVLVGHLAGDGVAPAAVPTERGIRVDSVYVGNARQLQALADMVARAAVHPVVDRLFPFESAREAFECLRHGDHFGKVVIRIE
jgi:NADPH:quinone reductase-like Zn-dependent oxidoreductase